MNRKIDIKAESFPWQAKLLGILCMFVAFFLAISHWWLAAIIAVLGLILVTGYSGTEINPESKTFREYTSYLFLRKGATEKYNGIEKIFINEANVSQKMYSAHTLNSSTFRSVVYNVYLKFDDGKKIFLTNSKNKSRLLNNLHPVASALGIDLVDNTVSNSTTI
jgi:hypothetical protein